MQTIAIAVLGASGRMGEAVVRQIAAHDDCRLAATVDRSTDAAALSGIDVLVDFSGAVGFDHALALCEARRIALVSGSTGLGATQFAAARTAARRIPLLWSSNFSLAMALLRRLTATAAATLGTEYDVEIIETHHRDKIDAPSGTALALGEAVAQARGKPLGELACHQRHGITGPRQPGEIGFAVLRAGDIVGEHTVMFGGPGERLELTHRATSREVFARGAVQAARWIAGRAPGWFDIVDVLHPG
jgi:4-hydroxy-tetrahydrodipicolinate reductase